MIAPVIEVVGGALEDFDARNAVDEVRIVAVSPVQVLAPEAQPRLSSQDASSVAVAARIGRLAGVAPVIDDCARQLGVVAPRSEVEVVAADDHPRATALRSPALRSPSINGPNVRQP